MDREFNWVMGRECCILRVDEDLSAEIIMYYDIVSAQNVYPWTVYNGYTATEWGKCSGLTEAMDAAEDAIKKIIKETPNG